MTIFDLIATVGVTPVDMRELKGLEIAARCRLTFNDGDWVVPSQSGNGTYRVTLNPPSCTCDDFGKAFTSSASFSRKSSGDR